MRTVSVQTVVRHGRTADDRLDDGTQEHHERTQWKRKQWGLVWQELDLWSRNSHAPRSCSFDMVQILTQQPLSQSKRCLLIIPHSVSSGSSPPPFHPGILSPTWTKAGRGILFGSLGRVTVLYRSAAEVSRWLCSIGRWVHAYPASAGA